MGFAPITHTHTHTHTHSYHNHNTEDMAIIEVATTDHTIIIIMYMQLGLDIGQANKDYKR